MKKTYHITVSEIRTTEFKVEAETDEEALDLAYKNYFNNIGVYDPNWEPYDDTTFEIDCAEEDEEET